MFLKEIFMMKIISRLLMLSIFLVPGFAPVAHAEGYLGGIVGTGSASGTAANLDSGLVLGATLGYRLVPDLGVAVTYQHSALKAGGIDVGVSQIMAEGNFFTLLFLQGGLHAGSVTTKVGEASSTDFGVGAHLGIDVHVTDSWTVGGQVYYTYVTQENDKHSLFNFVIPVKYWF